MSNMNVTYHRSMVAVLSALIDELEVADTGQLRKELTASLERAAALFAKEMLPMERETTGVDLSDCTCRVLSSQTGHEENCPFGSHFL